MKRLQIAWASALFAFGLVPAMQLSAADPVTTGNVNYRGLISANTPLNMNAGQNDGPNVKVYFEDVGVTLTSPLAVDRIGPNFGDFNSGTSGTIAAGTHVNDYLLHYDANGTGGNNDASGTITFNTPILGLIVFTTTLNNSDAIFAAPGVTYYTGNDRGLDSDMVNQGHGDDQFSVTNSSLTFNISGWTTTNIIDEVRVIVAVPETSTVLPAVLAAGVLLFSGLRKLC